ncbi:MAG: VCBS repeat-containing protein [Crocinitomicaceae bacterium]|nr:VCBS repeat-containing protein [Crocinitomicaceae bacterium]
MELLKMIPSVQIENFFFRNTKDLKFADKRADWGVDENLNSNGAAYADLDNDGDLDLVLNNVDAPASVYKNTTSNGNNFLKIDLSEVPDNELQGTKFILETKKGIQVAQANFVRGFQSTIEKSIFFYWSAGDTAEILHVHMPDKNKYQGNNEYKLEKFTPNSVLKLRKKDLEEEWMWRGPIGQGAFADLTDSLLPKAFYADNDFDDFKTETLLPHRMSDSGPQIAVSDLNNDGLDDFIMTSSAGKIPQVYIQKSDGTFGQIFSPAFTMHQGSEDGGLFFLKANKDEFMDVIISSGGYQFSDGDSNYINRLYIGNGQGAFGYVKNALPKDAFNSGKIIGEDIDKDGDQDLLICGKAAPGKYPYPGTTALLLNEKGFFIDITEKIAPGLRNIGMVNDAEFVDVDGDLDKDLVVVGEWMDIEIFIRDGGKFNQRTEKLNMPGWWSCITANDIDGDGDQDLLLGNAGMNNKFKASKEKPLDAYANDFDNNGSLDIVLAFTKDQHQLPVRGRECSSGQMPFLLEKFPTYLSFATSDLEQIYSKEKLDAALHYKVTEFNSGVLFNDGKGNFAFKKFPNKAQLSYINDFLVIDAYNDGDKEIVAVGNRYGTEVETTRSDAGCGVVINLSSQGEFYIWNTDFFAPGDAKCLAEIKLGKEGRGILVGNNNGRVQLFGVN